MKQRTSWLNFGRLNDRIIQCSDEFYSYQTPADFRLKPAKSRSSAHAKFPIQSWKKKFTERMPSFAFYFAGRDPVP